MNINSFDLGINYTGVATTGVLLEHNIFPFIQGKRVLITGADGNLGKACVTAAKSNLFEISMVHGSRQVDLGNPKAILDHFSGTKSYDLVIMTHGYQEPLLLENIIGSRHIWDYIISVNLSSCAYLTSFILQYEKINPGGMIVYISSIQATHPREGRGAYAAAKAGLEALMRTSAQEMKRIPARAIALRLGQFTTPMKGINFTKAQLKDIEKNVPLGLIDPQKVADLIFDLYKNPNLTGEVISIDSGHSLQIWT